MSKQKNPVARFMHRTGRLRAIFGPAAIGDLNEPVKEPTDEQRVQRADHRAQFVEKKLPNGQSYFVLKDTEGGSNHR